MVDGLHFLGHLGLNCLVFWYFELCLIFFVFSESIGSFFGLIVFGLESWIILEVVLLKF